MMKRNEESGKRRNDEGQKSFVSSTLRFFCSPLPLLLFLLLTTLPARAQEVPVLPPRSDSLEALIPARLPPPPPLPDSVEQFFAQLALPDYPPPGFAPPAPGRLVSRQLPARQPALGGADLLRTVPGSFLYNFGAIGWPDGWSPFGLPPHHVTLRLDGRPYDDLITGRPRYDLLPIEFMTPLRVGPDRLGTAEAVYARLRPYNVQAPLTELRYRTGGGGQGIAVLHTQQRRLSLGSSDSPGVLGVTAGYYGRGADNEYPNSDLRSARRYLARLRYETRTWSLEVTELHTRRSIGAHGGVVLPPEGVPFSAIYFGRANARVRNPEARRRTIRNDLALTFRTWLAPALGAPFTASAYWTKEFFRYTGPDTASAVASRYGIQLRQRAALGGHRLLLRLDATLTRTTGGATLPPGASRTRLVAGVRDAFTISGVGVAAEGALHLRGGRSVVSALVEVSKPIGRARLFGEVALTGQPFSFAAQHGYGAFLRPADSRAPGQVLRGRAGLSYAAGSFEATLFGFAHAINRPLDFYATGDTLEARTIIAQVPFRSAGLTAALDFRRDARRGLYASAQATYTRFLNPGASSLHIRAARALPKVFGQARLGARFALFTEDLIVDAYVRGRFWTALRSRTLHPPTGLLVLPLLPLPSIEAFNAIGPSGTIDIIVEAQIRTATLFFAYENALSGTRFHPGALIVPIYPLPAQRFRFGVYWPIFG